MPHAQQLYMRYAERDLTADQPGGPGCAMREWPLELETVQSRGGTLMDDRFVTMRWCWHGMAENKQKKAKKWSQKYKTEYSLHYPCIRKSERGNFHAFCTICSVDISVEHGGRDDIRKHVGSKRHTDIAKARSSSSSTLLNYFTKQGTSIYVYKKSIHVRFF